MKLILILAIGLGVGFTLSKLSSTQVTSAPPVAYQTWAQNGVKKIELSSSSAEQLAEAESYYGKAVVLFLATLYNKTQGSETSSLPHQVFEDKKEKPIVDGAIPSSEPTTSITTPIKENSKQEKLKEEKKTKDEDLKRLIAYRSSSVATKMTPEVRKMIGSFEGIFVQESGKNKGRVDRVEMDLMFEMREGKLAGQTRIILINPQGDVYSNSSGDGENQTLKLVEGTKDQIYIETAPGEFIIMDVSQPNQLSGKYFDPGGGYRGSVKVTRK